MVTFPNGKSGRNGRSYSTNTKERLEMQPRRQLHLPLTVNRVAI